MARYEPNSILRYERMANLIKTAQFEELIEGRQLDCASARRSAGIRSSLRDAGEAEEYLNAALEEGNPELFLLALRNVAEAQGGVAQLAEKANLNRESLYKILSERGNPELKSLDALLHALGFRLAVTTNH